MRKNVSKIKFYKLDRAGFSLVEAIIVVAIMGIASLATATMFGNISREMRAMQTQAAKAETANLLNLALKDGDVCTFHFSGMVIDVSDLVNTPPVINLAPGQSIRVAPNAMANPVVTVGAAASPMSPNLIVDSIQVSNFSLNLPDSYSADLRVNFRTDNGRSLRPLIHRININTNPLNAPNAKTILGCTPPPPVLAEELWAGNYRVWAPRSAMTINLNAGRNILDYRYIALIGGRPNGDISEDNFGRGNVIVPTALLIATPNYWFETQTFSGDDSGSIGMMYTGNNTQLRIGSFRNGNVRRIVGIR